MAARKGCPQERVKFKLKQGHGVQLSVLLTVKQTFQRAECRGMKRWGWGVVWLD